MERKSWMMCLVLEIPELLEPGNVAGSKTFRVTSGEGCYKYGHIESEYYTMNDRCHGEEHIAIHTFYITSSRVTAEFSRVQRKIDQVNEFIAKYNREFVDEMEFKTLQKLRDDLTTRDIYRCVLDNKDIAALENACNSVIKHLDLIINCYGRIQKKGVYHDV